MTTRRTRRTILVINDKSKGNTIANIDQSSNYRSFTYLALVWKLLTGMISENIY